MALTVTVRLPESHLDAAFLSGQPSPPHPAWLFCALVAAARHGPDGADLHADLAALRWLEEAGPPLVSLVDRTNARVPRPDVSPTDDHVVFTWPDAKVDDAVLWRLHRLARRIRHLGRSTSPTEVTVHDEATPEDGGEHAWARSGRLTYRPVPIGTPGSVNLRVPFTGYTDQLREAYEVGERAWEVARAVAYRCDSAPVGGPYRELVIWPLRRGAAPVSGDRLLTVTDLLRRTAISRVADPVPPEVSGHGADARPHLAYLALIDVGHPHAAGHVLGVAVAIPADLPGETRRVILRGLLGEAGEDPIRELRGGAGGLFKLDDPGEPPRQWGLRASRWTGPPEGARCWASVTPVMLDRYPGRRDPAEVLADTIVTAGYPRPETVTLLEEPLPQAAVRMPRRGTLPAGRPHRPMVHCRIEFAEPVRGPVIAGALRYLGCGLLVPDLADPRC